MRSWRALLAVALVLGMSMVAQGQSSSGNYQCRMAGAAANSGCGLPFALSNFQGAKSSRWAQNNRLFPRVIVRFVVDARHLIYSK